MKRIYIKIVKGDAWYTKLVGQILEVRDVGSDGYEHDVRQSAIRKEDAVQVSLLDYLAQEGYREQVALGMIYKKILATGVQDGEYSEDDEEILEICAWELGDAYTRILDLEVLKEEKNEKL